LAAPAFRVREMAGAPDLAPLAAAWPERYPCLLESASGVGRTARWDLLFAADAGAADAADVVAGSGSGFLDALERAWQDARLAPPGTDEAPPFRGGWVLFLGYELAGEVEPTLTMPAAAAHDWPQAFALRCPGAILVDRARSRTVLVAERGRERCFGQFAADLAQAPALPADVPALVEWREDDPRSFLAGVARVHEHLRAGDTFQVNLSRAWSGRFARPPMPAATYAALRRANPAPFAGLLQHGGRAIASSSPERLLEVRDGHAQTRPIAVTIPRHPGDDDRTRIRTLVDDPKERAEHVMLIDLERNDLGRVCVPGSVVVDELMQVESYAHVHHIVSNVRGRLRADVSPVDAIRAVFPGGTITGCPKVRCMEIIAALEGTRRGPYTGSLGYLNRDGDLDLNILIRTLELDGEHVRLRAGAGLVADSIAERELDETRAKARGMLRALGVAA
jgi:anthranilate synthase component 1